ncbi:GlsB/YeaQ/YmgE family stress response membrane protein [Vallicoccus soli]|uniref:GlsB/YeaQ/YmgE family stress response membrane protein n=1 Tax=Vallicoccus soli TaxID=2339232 RepID=A0A3A3Z0Q3_9ACTN|nr:GlsB/YeaQ/YmgE family stress response membrane protein [Vallicoccus soli]RJK97829.1 GlsB/YeaQ/YmgE family stress response membrane protein [Vallicoccus soli]
MEIIGLIVVGAVIGLLGKLVAPGDKDNVPILLTIVLGVVGVVAGFYLAAALGVEATSGIDWIRWIISIAVAAVLVVAASTIMGRNTSQRRI